MAARVRTRNRRCSIRESSPRALAAILSQSGLAVALAGAWRIVETGETWVLPQRRHVLVAQLSTILHAAMTRVALDSMLAALVGST
jgi:hypothetical protein